MPRPKSAQPSYLHHKPTNQAYCRIPDGSGGRRVVYLGRFNSPESELEYARTRAELAVGARPPQPAGSRHRHPDLTVSEVALAFWDHAERYYRRPDGTTTNELVEYRYTLRVLTDTHGGTPAREFGPLALKAVRQQMVARRWKRTTVNNRVRRIKHPFKWAVENELVPPAVHQALAAVAGLPKGRVRAGAGPGRTGERRGRRGHAPVRARGGPGHDPGPSAHRDAPRRVGKTAARGGRRVRPRLGPPSAAPQDGPQGARAGGRDRTAGAGGARGVRPGGPDRVLLLAAARWSRLVRRGPAPV